MLSRGTTVFQVIIERMAKEQTALSVVRLCLTQYLPHYYCRIDHDQQDMGGIYRNFSAALALGACLLVRRSIGMVCLRKTPSQTLSCILFTTRKRLFRDLFRPATVFRQRNKCALDWRRRSARVRRLRTKPSVSWFPLLSRSFTNQVLVQLDLLRYWRETTAYKNHVHLLPKQLDEQASLLTPLRNEQIIQVSRLKGLSSVQERHLPMELDEKVANNIPALRAKLNVFAQELADSMVVKVEGPSRVNTTVIEL